MRRERCLKCGARLPHGPGGRPRTYCSVGCRRAAEYEIRRTSRQLEELQKEEARYRRIVAGIDLPVPPVHIAQRKHSWVVDEIRAMEMRLRELLES